MPMLKLMPLEERIVLDGALADALDHSIDTTADAGDPTFSPDNPGDMALLQAALAEGTSDTASGTAADITIDIPGSELVADHSPGSDDSIIGRPGMVVVDGKLFFPGEKCIYSYDGSDIQKICTTEVNPILWTASVNGKILFTSTNTSSGQGSIWALDPQTNTTESLISEGITIWENPQHCQLGNKIFFQVMDSDKSLDIWYTDGTKNGTRCLKNFGNTAPTSMFESPTTAPGMAVVGDTLYFFGVGDGSPNADFDLWKTDGLSGATWVADLGTHIRLQTMAALKDRVVFNLIRGKDMSYTHELWATTEGGTEAILLDTIEGASGGNSTPLMIQYTNAQGREFVAAALKLDSNDCLWISDGETSCVINDASSPVCAGERLYFLHDMTPCSTDGTLKTNADGTLEYNVVEHPLPLQGAPNSIRLIPGGGDNLYISVLEGFPSSSFSLWILNDNSGELREINGPPPNASSLYHGVTMMEGKVYYDAFTLETGRELYTLDIPNTQEDTDIFIRGISISNADTNDTIAITLGVDHGELSLTAADGVTTTGLNTNQVTLTGTINHINQTLANLRYTPHENFNGVDTFTVTAGDKTEAFPVIVNSVNDAPVFTGSILTQGDQGQYMDLSGLIIGDEDVAPSDTTLFTITFNVTSGTLYTDPSSPRGSSFVITKTLAEINATLDSLGFKSDDGSTGSVTLSIDIYDRNNPKPFHLVRKSFELIINSPTPTPTPAPAPVPGGEPAPQGPTTPTGSDDVFAPSPAPMVPSPQEAVEAPLPAPERPHSDTFTNEAPLLESSESPGLPEVDNRFDQIQVSVNDLGNQSPGEGGKIQLSLKSDPSLERVPLTVVEVYGQDGQLTDIQFVAFSKGGEGGTVSVFHNAVVKPLVQGEQVNLSPEPQAPQGDRRVTIKGGQGDQVVVEGASEEMVLVAGAVDTLFTLTGESSVESFQKAMFMDVYTRFVTRGGNNADDGSTLMALLAEAVDKMAETQGDNALIIQALQRAMEGENTPDLIREVLQNLSRAFTLASGQGSQAPQS